MIADADWLRPGQEVVVLSGRLMAPSPVLTIERVLKRDVVLSNGDRWSRNRLHGDHITKPSASIWDGYSTLFPADHPRVDQARREQSERGGIARIRTLADKVSDAARAGRWEDAHRLVGELAPLLAERVGGES